MRRGWRWTVKGNDAAYNAIKKRHPDIPQDPLPLEMPAVAGGSVRDPERKQPGPKSIRFATCPKCLADRLTGVIRLGDGTQVFRGHNMVMHSGRRTPCPGSGQVAPPDPRS